MTVSVFYYDPQPEGGYVEPFHVAYYFNEFTMTILPSSDQRVVDFLANAGTIQPYEAPPAPNDGLAAGNGEALVERQRTKRKAHALSLLNQGKTEEAIKELLELI